VGVKLGLPYKLRVFETRELKTIFGPKRMEMVESWDNYTVRKFIICNCYEILLGWCYWGMRWAGYVVRTEMWEICTQFLSVTTKGRDHLEDLRRKLEDNIKMDLRANAWEVLDWMHLVQNTNQWGVLVNMVLVPWKVRNILTSWVTISFSM
jgi:hypothetical protein